MFELKVNYFPVLALALFAAFAFAVVFVFVEFAFEFVFDTAEFALTFVIALVLAGSAFAGRAPLSSFGLSTTF